MSTMQLAILCILTAAAPVPERSDWRAPKETASRQALAAGKSAALEGARLGTPVAGIRQDKPADVAGAWALTVETAQGTGTPSVIFKQDGEKVTGTYSSQIFGEQQVTGTIKGNAITFSFTGSVEGTAIAVTYSGTVEKDTMKGKVTLGDLGEGTFTGRKK
jgi:hypothetical protein